MVKSASEEFDELNDEKVEQTQIDSPAVESIPIEQAPQQQVEEKTKVVEEIKQINSNQSLSVKAATEHSISEIVNKASDSEISNEVFNILANYQGVSTFLFYENQVGNKIIDEYYKQNITKNDLYGFLKKVDSLDNKLSSGELEEHGKIKAVCEYFSKSNIAKHFTVEEKQMFGKTKVVAYDKDKHDYINVNVDDMNAVENEVHELKYNTLELINALNPKLDVIDTYKVRSEKFIKDTNIALEVMDRVIQSITAECKENTALLGVNNFVDSIKIINDKVKPKNKLNHSYSHEIRESIDAVFDAYANHVWETLFEDQKQHPNIITDITNQSNETKNQLYELFESFYQEIADNPNLQEINHYHILIKNESLLLKIMG